MVCDDDVSCYRQHYLEFLRCTQGLETIFFRRYLEAPLRMVGLEGECGQVRIRKVRKTRNLFPSIFGNAMGGWATQHLRLTSSTVPTTENS